jgi:hypothetical protein
MRMNELVEVYESTRRTAATIGTWRLRRWARRVRRALDRKPGDEIEQVRLVALESELAQRGVSMTRSLPVL